MDKVIMIYKSTTCHTITDGDIVTIAYSLLVNGENIIELTIIYTNGQIYILLLLYKKEGKSLFHR